MTTAPFLTVTFLNTRNFTPADVVKNPQYYKNLVPELILTIRPNEEHRWTRKSLSVPELVTTTFPGISQAPLSNKLPEIITLCEAFTDDAAFMINWVYHDDPTYIPPKDPHQFYLALIRSIREVMAKHATQTQQGWLIQLSGTHFPHPERLAILPQPTTIVPVPHLQPDTA